MNLEVNIISIPDAVTADDAKEMVCRYKEAETKKDIETILNYLRTKPWDDIRTQAKIGKTSTFFTIGYDAGITCRVNANYGWTWLKDEGAKLITNLFSSLGYEINYEWYVKFVRINIKWAE